MTPTGRSRRWWTKGWSGTSGISNMTIPKLNAVLDQLRIHPAACESEMHPCFQQQEILDYLKAHDILPIA